MLGFLSFLAFACAIAFVVSVVLLVLRLIKKKSWKPCAVSAAVAVVCVLGLSMPISQLYVPAEKQEESTTASAVDFTSNVDNSVETVEKPTADTEESSEPEQSVASEATTEPASAPAESPAVSPAESSADDESGDSPSSAAPSESETDTTQDVELIRSLFDGLLSEYDGGVVSIEPRTIDGDVFSWAIIDVVVPDSWYYLEDYQKERYCENVGDYVRSAVVSGGVAENEAGVAVHFFDGAGAEIASSKVFGGYELK